MSLGTYACCARPVLPHKRHCPVCHALYAMDATHACQDDVEMGLAHGRRRLFEYLSTRNCRTEEALRRLHAAAEAVVRHWDEFGPEYGLDEVIECLRRTLAQGERQP